MNHPFGFARALYRKNLHPRVLIGPLELARLRRTARSGAGKKILAVMRSRVTPLIREILAAKDVAGRFAEDRDYRGVFGGAVCDAMHSIAMIGVLDEDARAIDAARRILVSFPRAEPQFNYDIFIHGRVTPSILAFDLIHAQLTAEERRVFCGWLIETQVRKIIAARRPSFYKQAGMNLAYGKVLAAIHAVLAVQGEDGVGSLETELKELVSFFEASLNVAISSDGYLEEDTGYGTNFLAFLCLAADALRRAGVFDALQACPRLAQTGRAILHIVEPWGTRIANTGDAGDDFAHREYVLPALAKATNDPVLIWLFGALCETDKEVEIRRGCRVPAEPVTLIKLDLLKKSVHPSKARVPTAFLDRRRGFVTFRSGWEKEDTLVVFDGSQRSPAAQGHAHASCGHFDLSALGEYFAIDTGRYNIDQDQHNVVLVDGRNGHSSNGEWRATPQHGLLIDYLPDGFCDFTAADSSHQHNCYWARRSLGFVKGVGAPAYAWTVEDVNKANDYREFWWQLQTSPENIITTRESSATIQGWRHGNLLDVSWILPDPSAYSKPHTLSVTQDVQSCSSTKYITDPHADARRCKRPSDMVHWSVFVRPRLIAKVAGYNGRFMSLMIPRRKGMSPAKIMRLPSIDNSLAVQITFPTVQDTLIFAYEHNLLEAGDVRGRGQWCVVRRSRETGRVLQTALGHGTSLAVAGKPIRAALSP